MTGRNAADPVVQLAKAAKKAREATVERDRLIVLCHHQGESLRWIGRAAGLSHTAVAKILAK